MKIDPRQHKCFSYKTRAVFCFKANTVHTLQEHFLRKLSETHFLVECGQRHTRGLNEQLSSRAVAEGPCAVTGKGLLLNLSTVKGGLRVSLRSRLLWGSVI